MYKRRGSFYVGWSACMLATTTVRTIFMVPGAGHALAFSHSYVIVTDNYGSFETIGILRRN